MGERAQLQVQSHRIHLDARGMVLQSYHSFKMCKCEPVVFCQLSWAINCVWWMKAFL